jgi:glucose/arabinose dehydrogenase
MRRLLVGAFALALLTVTCVTASGSVAPSSVHVRFHEVVSGLSSPVAVTSARDGSRRLFVVQQGGTVRVVRNGQLRSQTYLDLGGRLVSGGEQGLLSIAFHRHFGRHPFVYAAYTRASDGALVVSRFRAASADATSVAKSTERHLLTVPHPEQTNHNGGQLLFGRHGYLYITTGDGGGAGDPFANAENLNSLSGKVLRINVNRSCGQKHYCIPQGRFSTGACVTRGGCRSTAPPAGSGSPTSARTCGKKSTMCVRSAARTSGGRAGKDARRTTPVVAPSTAHRGT